MRHAAQCLDGKTKGTLAPAKILEVPRKRGEGSLEKKEGGSMSQRRRLESQKEASGVAATPEGRFLWNREGRQRSPAAQCPLLLRQREEEGQSVVRASGAMLDCRGAASSKLVKSPGVMAPGQFGPL